MTTVTVLPSAVDEDPNGSDGNWSAVSNGELPVAADWVAVVRVDAEKNELIFGCCETEASTSAFLRRFSQPLKCFFIEDIVLQLAQKQCAIIGNLRIIRPVILF